MGKYRTNSVKAIPQKSGQPHFLWRGIGCVMMLIIPVIAFAAGYETINFALKNGYTVPYQLLGTPRFPDLFYKSSGMMTLLRPIIGIQHFYAYVVMGFIYMIGLGGVMSVAYAFVYRMIGPSRYSPLDAPPPKIKAKTYKR